jgi:hypothetical protein
LTCGPFSPGRWATGGIRSGDVMGNIGVMPRQRDVNGRVADRVFLPPRRLGDKRSAGSLLQQACQRRLIEKILAQRPRHRFRFRMDPQLPVNVLDMEPDRVDRYPELDRRAFVAVSFH